MIQDTYSLAFNVNFAKAELFCHRDTLVENCIFGFLLFFFPLNSFTICNFVGNLDKGSLH